MVYNLTFDLWFQFSYSLFVEKEFWGLRIVIIYKVKRVVSLDLLNLPNSFARYLWFLVLISMVI